MYLFELIDEERDAAREVRTAEQNLSNFLGIAEDLGKTPEEYHSHTYQLLLEDCELAQQRLERVHNGIKLKLQTMK